MHMQIHNWKQSFMKQNVCYDARELDKDGSLREDSAQSWPGSRLMPWEKIQGQGQHQAEKHKIY